MAKGNNKPATKADLMAAIKMLLRQLDGLITRRVRRAFNEIKQEINKVLKLIKANQRDFLSTERAVIDKLKEHEERIKQLEERQLNNPWRN